MLLLLILITHLENRLTEKFHHYRSLVVGTTEDSAKLNLMMNETNRGSFWDFISLSFAALIPDVEIYQKLDEKNTRKISQVASHAIP